MLTLKELRNLVEEPKQGVKLPTARALRESDTPIVVKEIMGNAAELTVYRNGYALYQVKNRATVFPVNGCKAYSYATNKESVNIEEQVLEQEKWYIRLMLEGEDRLSHNLYMKEESHQISYSAVAEDWDQLADKSISIAEKLAEEAMVEELLQTLTERQRKVVVEYFYQEKTHQQIADEIGITRPAVSDAMAKAISRMKKLVQK